MRVCQAVERFIKCQELCCGACFGLLFTVMQFSHVIPNQLNCHQIALIDWLSPNQFAIRGLFV